LSSLPLLITADELAAARDQLNLLLIDLSDPQAYAQGHIPGAIHVHPAETQWGKPPAPGLLPASDNLQALIQRIGLREDQQVVVYDDEGGGWAGRMIWLLDCIGFANASLLSGGLQAWLKAGLPISREVISPGQSNYTIQLNPVVNVVLEELIQLVNSKLVKIWDARSPQEFSGQRQTTNRSGHIPGAVNYEWTRAMDMNDARKIRNLNNIRDELKALGIDASNDIVTHCQSHHRSGLTYLIGKALGFKIRAYPGSWSEWGNHPDTPIE